MRVRSAAREMRTLGSSWPVRTFHWGNGPLRFLDQTELPHRQVMVVARTPGQLAEAIRSLRIRGAPAIGVAAAYGVVLAVTGLRTASTRALAARAKRAAALLRSCRPTAVNLFFALEAMERCIEASLHLPPRQFCLQLLAEARRLEEEDWECGRRIGEHGAALLPESARVLTHCNAGGLGTTGYGTALAVVYAAVQQGKKVSVWVDETRPLLQGARLTMYELLRARIPATLVADAAAPALMARGLVDVVVVGADRIARNGDAANKIGTYSLALAAREHSVPFYVAAPSSSFDLKAVSGLAIPIEHRDGDEVLHFAGRRIAPKGAAAYNPAFDVTPGRFITCIITEAGVLRPPYRRSIRGALGSQRRTRS